MITDHDDHVDQDDPLPTRPPTPRDLVYEADKYLQKNRRCRCGRTTDRKHCSQRCRDDARNEGKRQRRAEQGRDIGPYQPAIYQLSDTECLHIEAEAARLHPYETPLPQLKRDSRGNQVGRDHEAAYAAGFSKHDRKAFDGGYPRDWHWPKPCPEGAELDVWEIRRVDRERFGGVVLYQVMAPFGKG